MCAFLNTSKPFVRPGIADSVDGFDIPGGGRIVLKLIPEALDRDGQCIFIHILGAVGPNAIHKLAP